jgi:hypothetical protein
MTITHHYHPPPPVSRARAMFLISRGGGHWQGGPCFFFRRGGSIDTRTGGPLTRVLVKKSKKNSLCMHFLACAIGVNVVRTHAWYLLHLCGGCGAHVSHLLQFFHAFTPFFFSFFCNRLALSSDKALRFTTRSLHQCCRAQSPDISCGRKGKPGSVPAEDTNAW